VHLPAAPSVRPKFTIEQILGVCVVMTGVSPLDELTFSMKGDCDNKRLAGGENEIVCEVNVFNTEILLFTISAASNIPFPL